MTVIREAIVKLSLQQTQDVLNVPQVARLKREYREVQSAVSEVDKSMVGVAKSIQDVVGKLPQLGSGMSGLVNSATAFAGKWGGVVVSIFAAVEGARFLARSMDEVANAQRLLNEALEKNERTRARRALTEGAEGGLALRAARRIRDPRARLAALQGVAGGARADVAAEGAALQAFVEEQRRAVAEQTRRLPAAARARRFTEVETGVIAARQQEAAENNLRSLKEEFAATNDILRLREEILEKEKRETEQKIRKIQLEQQQLEAIDKRIAKEDRRIAGVSGVKGRDPRFQEDAALRQAELQAERAAQVRELQQLTGGLSAADALAEQQQIFETLTERLVSIQEKFVSRLDHIDSVITALEVTMKRVEEGARQ